ncbi:MAG: hypothetical protein ABI854_01035 [Betaproteobacteria bacterium]
MPDPGAPVVPPPSPAAGPDVAPPAPPPPSNRITGIETNREMIAAEAPTEIVINGTAAANCALVIDFGDGTRAVDVVSDTSPFPRRISHTYPKTAEVTVRVIGTTQGAILPCEGTLEAAVHVSPAGSKIEYITLTTGCPEGWLLKGAINPDKSFMCAPIPDASAPTNLIHCIDGMKYFARDGHVGCRFPQAALAEVVEPPKATKGKRGKGKAPAKADAVAKPAAGSIKPPGKSAPKPKAVQP